MHMGMVMVVSGRNVIRPIGIGCGFIVNMIVTVLVAVVPEMCSLARCVLQRIANAHRCRVSGVQREHDGKNERNENAHIGKQYRGGQAGCLLQQALLPICPWNFPAAHPLTR